MKCERCETSEGRFCSECNRGMKAIDDTPRSSRTFEVTIPCPHCRRLLDVFLKEAS